MATIPLKCMKTIYDRASNFPDCNVYLGNYRAVMDYPIFNLYHYGTLILALDIERGIKYVGGFSASDRDAINSILRITCINERVSIAGGTMHVVND